MNQLKSVYNIPFLDSYPHHIHTCLSIIGSNVTITNMIDQENSSLLFIFYRSMITCLMLRKQNLLQSLSSRYLVEHVDFRLHVKILPLLPIKTFNIQDLTRP